MSFGFARSTLILIASQAFYNGGLALEVILLRRWFEDAPLGGYFTALSLAGLFEVGVHWGAQHMVNREAAARLEALNRWLPGLAAASLLTVAAATAAVAWLHQPALGIIAGAALVRAGSTLLGGICIGRGHVVPPAVSRVLSPVVGLVGLVVLVRPEPSLARLAVVVSLATAGYALPLVLAHRRLGTTLVARPARWWSAWRWLAVHVWPFVLVFFCAQLLSRADGALLEWLDGDEAVAVYMTAFKWVEGLFFLPYVVASATIPALVAAKEGGTKKTLTRVCTALFGGTLGLALLLLVAGEPILLLLVGERFQPSVPLYRLFVWLLPIHGLGVLFAAALVAEGRERSLVAVTALAAAVGLAVRLGAYPQAGTDAFVAGTYLGLLTHAIGCGGVLWRHLAAPPCR
jgi:O-antigen/teichoic acid export membrane protein